MDREKMKARLDAMADLEIERIIDALEENDMAKNYSVISEAQKRLGVIDHLVMRLGVSVSLEPRAPRT